MWIDNIEYIGKHLKDHCLIPYDMTIWDVKYKEFLFWSHKLRLKNEREFRKRLS